MSTVTITPAETPLCDCCNAVNPKNDYDAGRDLIIPTLGYEFHHLWVVCDTCAGYIDDNDWKGLLSRVLSLYHVQAAIDGRPPSFIAHMDKLYTEVYRRLGEQGMRRCFYCESCGRVSYNPDDRKNRYCGNCHIFA